MQAGAGGLDPFAEAQDHALFVGLDLEDAGAQPSQENDAQQQGKALAAKAEQVEVIPRPPAQAVGGGGGSIGGCRWAGRLVNRVN